MRGSETGTGPCSQYTEFNYQGAAGFLCVLHDSLCIGGVDDF